VSTKTTFEVPAEDAGLRLDQVIPKHVPGLSRRKARAVIDLGGVFVDRARVTVAGRPVRPGQVIEVNIGGALGPILALQVRENLGIEFVLVTSSITSFFCLLGTLLFFREPEREPGEVAPASFGKVLRDMALVFRNVRFLSFLVIFSGFWIMFWQIFYSLPFYLTEVLKFERFELIETVDAWTTAGWASSASRSSSPSWPTRRGATRPR
jgi:hypothetical protein